MKLYVFYCLIRIIHTYTTRSFLVFKNYYRDLMDSNIPGVPDRIQNYFGLFNEKKK